MDDLLEGYESVSGALTIDRERLKWWILFGSAKWGVICLGMGAMFSFGLDRSIERSVVARRVSEAELDLLSGIRDIEAGSGDGFAYGKYGVK